MPLEHALQEEKFHVAETASSSTLARVVDLQEPMDEPELSILDQDGFLWGLFLLLLSSQGFVSSLTDQYLISNLRIPVLGDVSSGVDWTGKPQYLVEPLVGIAERLPKEVKTTLGEIMYLFLKAFSSIFKVE